MFLTSFYVNRNQNHSALYPTANINFVSKRGNQSQNCEGVIQHYSLTRFNSQTFTAPSITNTVGEIYFHLLKEQPILRQVKNCQINFDNIGDVCGQT